MSYDIPDEIKYKEKLAFNLDFKQLLYAVIFILLAVFSYSLPISGQAKFVFPSLFILLGIGFVYLKFDEYLFVRFKYWFGFKEGSWLNKKVRDLVGIEEIEGHTVFLKDNELRSVIIVDPINYDTLNDEQKKSLIINYQEFLNQLDFKIQIKVRTVNTNVSEYYTNTKIDEKKMDAETRKIYDDLKAYELDFLKKNRVKERLFYLVVPFNTELEQNPDKIQKSMKRLSERTDLVRAKLAQCGLNSRRLTTNELISLYNSYFDGYVEVNEEYLDRISVAKQFFYEREEKKHA
ncbi:Uncharacterised protein [uncultured archaeon]|nr:Uncharacterised protein [uncultured archaeon]